MAFYTKQARKPQIVLVSLIDILTILLIFFVVTTTFKTPESQLELTLPSSKRSKAISNPRPQTPLTVTADQRIFLDGVEVKLDDLANTIKAFLAEHPDRQIVLKGDTGVPYGTVLEIFDAMKDAGMKTLPAFADAKKQAAAPSPQ